MAEYWELDLDPNVWGGFGSRAKWEEEYKKQHGYYPGQGPESYEEALRNLRWSQDYWVREHGNQPMTEEVWKAHYYRPQDFGDYGQYIDEAKRILGKYRGLRESLRIEPPSVRKVTSGIGMGDVGLAGSQPWAAPPIPGPVGYMPQIASWEGPPNTNLPPWDPMQAMQEPQPPAPYPGWDPMSAMQGPQLPAPPSVPPPLPPPIPQPYVPEPPRPPSSWTPTQYFGTEQQYQGGLFPGPGYESPLRQMRPVPPPQPRLGRDAGVASQWNPMQAMPEQQPFHFWGAGEAGERNKQAASDFLSMLASPFRAGARLLGQAGKVPGTPLWTIQQAWPTVKPYVEQAAELGMRGLSQLSVLPEPVVGMVTGLGPKGARGWQAIQQAQLLAQGGGITTPEEMQATIERGMQAPAEQGWVNRAVSQGVPAAQIVQMSRIGYTLSTHPERVDDLAVKLSAATTREETDQILREAEDPTSEFMGRTVVDLGWLNFGNVLRGVPVIGTYLAKPFIPSARASAVEKMAELDRATMRLARETDQAVKAAETTTELRGVARILSRDAHLTKVSKASLDQQQGMLIIGQAISPAQTPDEALDLVARMARGEGYQATKTAGAWVNDRQVRRLTGMLDDAMQNVQLPKQWDEEWKATMLMAFEEPMGVAAARRWGVGQAGNLVERAWGIGQDVMAAHRNIVGTTALYLRPAYAVNNAVGDTSLQLLDDTFAIVPTARRQEFFAKMGLSQDVIGAGVGQALTETTMGPVSKAVIGITRRIPTFRRPFQAAESARREVSWYVSVNKALQSSKYEALKASIRQMPRDVAQRNPVLVRQLEAIVAAMDTVAEGTPEMAKVLAGQPSPYAVPFTSWLPESLRLRIMRGEEVNGVLVTMPDGIWAEMNREWGLAIARATTPEEAATAVQRVSESYVAKLRKHLAAAGGDGDLAKMVPADKGMEIDAIGRVAKVAGVSGDEVTQAQMIYAKTLAEADQAAQAGMRQLQQEIVQAGTPDDGPILLMVLFEQQMNAEQVRRARVMQTLTETIDGIKARRVDPQQAWARYFGIAQQSVDEYRQVVGQLYADGPEHLRRLQQGEKLSAVMGVDRTSLINRRLEQFLQTEAVDEAALGFQPGKVGVDEAKFQAKWQAQGTQLNNARRQAFALTLESADPVKALEAYFNAEWDFLNSARVAFGKKDAARAAMLLEEMPLAEYHSLRNQWMDQMWADGRGRFKRAADEIRNIKKPPEAPAAAVPEVPTPKPPAPPSVAAPEPPMPAAAAQRTLTEALRSAIRSARIGGEIITDADPVARSLLGRDLRSVEEFVGQYATTSPKVIGAGFGSIVLDIGGGRVVRLGVTTGEWVPPPAIDEILQPIVHRVINNTRVQIYPRVSTAGITEADVTRMTEALRRKGFSWAEAGTDNLGRTADGRLIVTDPGGIDRMMPAAAPSPAAGVPQSRFVTGEEAERLRRQAEASPFMARPEPSPFPRPEAPTPPVPQPTQGQQESIVQLRDELDANRDALRNWPVTHEDTIVYYDRRRPMALKRNQKERIFPDKRAQELGFEDEGQFLKAIEERVRLENDIRRIERELSQAGEPVREYRNQLKEEIRQLAQERGVPTATEAGKLQEGHLLDWAQKNLGMEKPKKATNLGQLSDEELEGLRDALRAYQPTAGKEVTEVRRIEAGPRNYVLYSDDTIRVSTGGRFERPTEQEYMEAAEAFGRRGLHPQDVVSAARTDLQGRKLTIVEIGQDGEVWAVDAGGNLHKGLSLNDLKPFEATAAGAVPPAPGGAPIKPGPVIKTRPDMGVPGAAGDIPPIPSVRTPLLENQIDEVTQAVQRGLMEHWNELRQPAVQAADAQAVRQWVESVVLPNWKTAEYAAKQAGKAVAEFSMGSPNKLYWWDQLLNLWTSYSYWTTRQGLNTARRAITRPALLTTYVKVRDYMNQQYEQAGYPQRAKMGKLPVTLDNGDVITLDIMNFFVPYAEGFMTWDTVEDQDNAVGTWVEAATKFGIRPHPWILALLEGEEMYKPLYPTDYSWYLPFASQARFLKSASALVASEAPQLGLPAGGIGPEAKYGAYYRGRALRTLQERGEITEEQRSRGDYIIKQAQAGEITWAGALRDPIVQMAEKEVGRTTGMRDVSSFMLGAGVERIPAEELSFRQKATAAPRVQYPGMETPEFKEQQRQYYEQNPTAAGVPATLEKAATGYFWTLYYSLPPKSEPLNDPFISEYVKAGSDGRGELDPKIIQAGITTMENWLLLNPQTPEQKKDNEEARRRMSAANTQLRKEYPEYDKWNGQYFASPQGSQARRDYLYRNPLLPKAWERKDQLIQQDPLLNRYYGAASVAPSSSATSATGIPPGASTSPTGTADGSFYPASPAQGIPYTPGMDVPEGMVRLGDQLYPINALGLYPMKGHWPGYGNIEVARDRVAAGQGIFRQAQPRVLYGREWRQRAPAGPRGVGPPGQARLPPLRQSLRQMPQWVQIPNLWIMGRGY